MQPTTATADTRRLTEAAMVGLDCISREGLLHGKSGVALPTSAEAAAGQGWLVLRPDDPRSEAPMASAGALDRRSGRGSTMIYGEHGG